MVATEGLSIVQEYPSISAALPPYKETKTFSEIPGVVWIILVFE